MIKRMVNLRLSLDFYICASASISAIQCEIFVYTAQAFDIHCGGYWGTLVRSKPFFESQKIRRKAICTAPRLLLVVDRVGGVFAHFGCPCESPCDGLPKAQPAIVWRHHAMGEQFDSLEFFPQQRDQYLI